jgi:hypothetical protein
MHDIKYFFSIKIIRQFRGGKKIFRDRQITENIIEKYYFSKFRGVRTPYHLGSAPVSPHQKSSKLYA